MIDSGVYTEREIPDYIFKKKYAHLAFADFSSVFVHRIEEYLRLLMLKMKTSEHQDCTIYLLDENKGEKWHVSGHILPGADESIDEAATQHKICKKDAGKLQFVGCLNS